jgi:SagB-type dehydrogenase family enzyme
MSAKPLQLVYDYHRESKHRLDRYAPGPGGLDWANQPEPFRVFQGAELIELPFEADAHPAPFALIRAGHRPSPLPVGLAPVAALLELSFGLSAWKSYGGTRWALRCNPSSGNLHPTECYLVTAACPGLAAGVYHYVSRDHCLERRADAGDPGPPVAHAEGVVLGLSSLHWREAWKYGLRAYRYCQHDVGHAIAAVAYAAAVLGWRVHPLPWGDAQLAGLLGLDRQEGVEAGDREAPDLALWVGADAPTQTQLEDLLSPSRRFFGSANRLSPHHRDWPEVGVVGQACERARGAPITAGIGPARPTLLPTASALPAASLIRQRRSAVDFDGVTRLASEHWFAMLDALLPRPEVPPLDAWPPVPRVHLVLFVHRVEGVVPGLYLLARSDGAAQALREGLRKDWLWAAVPGAPAHLPLYCLAQGDTRAAARQIACHQDIASDGCFAVAMLAELDAALREGTWRYRELFWECGIVGQTLYLEAEAAGVRGTGIGCFFDDAVHALLGIGDTRWQSLYHFTVGGPVEDRRLQTEPPYSGSAAASSGSG